MDKNKVTTAIKEHEGQAYIEVTSVSPSGEVVYTHSAWIDNDPELHHVLLQHSWSLNQRTGHLVTQTPVKMFLMCLQAQGDVPDQVTLPRCLAAAVAGGKKLLQVQADPTDYRYAALTIKWDHSSTMLHFPSPAAETRVLAVSEVQSASVLETRQTIAAQRRADAEARRLSADARRNIAEQRAQAKHFERLEAKRKREAVRNSKIAGRDLALLCQAQADVMLHEAQLAGAPWAEDAARVYAGHKPKSLIPAPADYTRLRKGLPIAIPQTVAAAEFAERYRRSQDAFEEYTSLFIPGFSRAAMRVAWLNRHPEHDWVAWEDSTYSPMVERHREQAGQGTVETTTPKLAAPAIDQRAAFEAKWARGETSCGLPAPRLAEWDARFSACSDRDEREALRREMLAEEKEHAWTSFAKGAL